MLDVKLKGKNGVLNIRNKQLETSSLVKLEVEGDLHLNQRISWIIKNQNKSHFRSWAVTDNAKSV